MFIDDKANDSKYLGISIGFIPFYFNDDATITWEKFVFYIEVFENSNTINLKNEVSTSTYVWNSNKSKHEEKTKLFIPYYALGLEGGNHELLFLLKCKRETGEIIELTRKEIKIAVPTIKKQSYQSQTFLLRNLNLNFNASYASNTDKGIRLTFDLLPKLSLDEIINASISEEYRKYYVKAVLKDENNDLIYFPESSFSNRLQIEPELDMNTGQLKELRDLQLFIPYKNIKKQGAFMATLELVVENKDGSVVMPAISKSEIEILKPMLYNYEEQEFKLIKNSIEVDIEKEGQLGLSIELTYRNKFGPDQILGADTNERLMYYYLFPLIIDSKGNDVLSPILAQTNISEFEKNYYYNEVKALSTDNTNYLRFFVPYRWLNLSEGKHELTIKLCVSDYAQKQMLREVFDVKKAIYFPPLHFIRYHLSALQVANLDYDVAGKNIPIVNLFISEKSKAGKGYPDLMWYVNVGNYSIYRSSVKRNSLIGESASTFFKMSQNDKAFLEVLDRDITSKHELIGKWEFPSCQSPCYMKYDSIQFGNVTSVSMTFQKKIIPFVKIDELIVQPSTKDGISGFNTTVSYLTDGLNKGDDIYSIPVISSIFDKNERYVPSFISKDTSISNKPFYKINSNNYKGKFVFFTPYYQMANHNKLSIDFVHENEKYRVIAAYADTKVPLALNDTKTSFLFKENYQNDDFTGILVEVKHQIPMMYYKAFKFYDIRNNIAFFDTEKQGGLNRIIQEIVAYKTLENDIIFNDFVNENNEFERSFFIPYYKLYPSKGKQSLKVSLNTVLHELNYQIGNNEKTFEYIMPQLFELQLQKYDLQIKKRRKYKSLFWEVHHGNRLIYRTEPLENNSKTVHWEKLPAEKIIGHAQDKVHLFLLGLDKNNRETLITVWHFDVYDFYKSQPQQLLKRNSKIKSGKIQFFIH